MVMQSMFVKEVTEIGNALGLEGEFLKEFGFIQIMEKIKPTPPPQEFEEVEVSAGWVNIYEKTATDGRLLGMGSFATKKEADEAAEEAATKRISCQEIRVKVARPVPQKVERSVSINGKADAVGDIDLNGRFGLDFIHGGHVENKIPAGSDVQITFTWTE